MTRTAPELRARGLNNRVALTWQHHPTATEYRVYSSGTLLATVASTALDPQATYLHTGLYAGWVSSYHVEAWAGGSLAYTYPGVVVGTDQTSRAGIAPRGRMLLANRWNDLDANINDLAQWDVVVLNPSLGYRVRALREQHPHITWLAYTNPHYINTSDKTVNAGSNMPATEANSSWWLYQSNGTTHWINADFGASYWGTRIDDPAYVEAFAAWAIRRCKADGLDGVFLDDIASSIPHVGSQALPTRYAGDGTSGRVYEQDVHDMLFTIGTRLRDAGLLTAGNVTISYSSEVNRLRRQRKFSSHLDMSVREFAATNGDTTNSGDSSYMMVGTEWWWCRDLVVAGWEMGSIPVLQEYVPAGHSPRSRATAAFAYTVGDAQLPGAYMFMGISSGVAVPVEPWPGPITSAPTIVKDSSWSRAHSYSGTDGVDRTGRVLLNLTASAQTISGTTVPPMDAVIISPPKWAPLATQEPSEMLAATWEPATWR